jgi:hypothetical protein
MDELGERAMHAVLSAFYVVAGVVIVGRALNSQMVMNVADRPVIGPASQALRGVWNQVYDVSSQD